MFVFLEQLLRVVWTIERLAIRVITWPSVIATHDEMSHSVVLADKRMPDGLTRSAHTHSQRQQ